MRIRPVLIAVPACAAAGVLGFRFVNAQDAPPAGYYAPRTTAHPSVNDPQYLRPLNTPSNDPPPPQPGWSSVPAKLAGVPADVSTIPPRGNNRPSKPVVSGPNPVIIPAGGTKKNDPPPPTLAPPNLAPPTLTPPAFEPPPLPPPKVTLEPTEPKQLPVLAPASSAPVVTVTPPALPATVPPQLLLAPPPVVPTVPTTPAPPPAPTGPRNNSGFVMDPPAAAPTAPAAVPPVGFVNTPPALSPSPFPPGPLPAKHAPAVTVEVAAPETVGVGQSLTYELVVKNGGPGAVANVSVTDDVPTGAKFVSADPPAQDQGGRLGWTIGMMEPGQEKRIRVTVKPGDEGELRSRAVVSFSAGAEGKVKVTRPKVAVVMTANDSVRVGEAVPFQIRVSNTGTGAATKLLIQAKLTDGLTHPQGTVIEAELATLAAGETKPIVLPVTAGRPGTHACVVTIVGEGIVCEPARVSVTVVEPALTAKVNGPARCMVRAEPVYAFDLANPGTAATDPLTAWAVVPEGFEFGSASDGGQYNPANRTVGWRLPGLTPAATKTLTLKLKASGPADGSVRFVAQTTPPAGGAVTQASFGTAARVLEAKGEQVVKAEGVPALRFEVADLDDPVEVGKDAVYEIKVVNQGTAACTGVVLTAVLADGTTASGATGPTTGRGQGTQVAFDPLPTLAPKAEVVYQVRVKGAVPGDMRFRVMMTSDQMKTPVVKEETTRFYKE